VLTRFQEQCLDLVHAIPPGRWASYGDIAERVGSTGRGVASALMAAPEQDVSGGYDPKRDVAPWWRLRAADGALNVPSLFGDAAAAVWARRNKEYVAEGGIVRNGRAIPEQRHRFSG
jgi:alkylated DNA nucleotide flippase Atl1